MGFRTRTYLVLAGLLASSCTGAPDDNTITYDETDSYGRAPRDGGTAVRFDAGVLVDSMSGGSSTSLALPSSAVSTASSAAGTSASSAAVLSSSSSSRMESSSASAAPSSTATSQVVVTSSSAAPSSSAPRVDAFVYAHSDTSLYRLDADTLSVTNLGVIQWFDQSNVSIPDGDSMTDLAVNSAGDAYACSFDWLYHVDIATRHARRVAPLTDNFNGLTFVPAGILDPTREVLVGATNGSGSLFRINLITGVATAIGSYGGGLISSGDVVAIIGGGMYATVTEANSTEPDMLASINPVTGVATVIGTDIGYENLWGVGYWGGTLYGFSSSGQVIAINRTTGRGTLLTTQPAQFWGAGVTTAANTQ